MAHVFRVMTNHFCQGSWGLQVHPNPWFPSTPRGPAGRRPQNRRAIARASLREPPAQKSHTTSMGLAPCLAKGKAASLFRKKGEPRPVSPSDGCPSESLSESHGFRTERKAQMAFTHNHLLSRRFVRSDLLHFAEGHDSDCHLPVKSQV